MKFFTSKSIHSYMGIFIDLMITSYLVELKTIWYMSQEFIRTRPSLVYPSVVSSVHLGKLYVGHSFIICCGDSAVF